MFPASFLSTATPTWRAAGARQVRVPGRRLGQAGPGLRDWVTSPTWSPQGKAPEAFCRQLPAHSLRVPAQLSVAVRAVAAAPPAPSLTGHQTLCTSVWNGAEQTRGFQSWTPRGQVTSPRPPRSAALVTGAVLWVLPGQAHRRPRGQAGGRRRRS